MNEKEQEDAETALTRSVRLALQSLNRRAKLAVGPVKKSGRTANRTLLGFSVLLAPQFH